MKASLILVALALCAVSAVYGSSLQSDNKMGRCRRVTGMGLCIEHCQRDSQCDGMDKCCSNGCGRSCQTPTFADEDEDDEIEGQCPLNEVIGICAIDMTRNHCGEDDKCEPGFKCCDQGCNRECVKV